MFIVENLEKPGSSANVNVAAIVSSIVVLSIVILIIVILVVVAVIIVKKKVIHGKMSLNVNSVVAINSETQAIDNILCM